MKKFKYKLEITNPSKTTEFVNYRSHFKIEGKISGKRKVPDNAILLVQLFDQNGKEVRYAISFEKGGKNIFVKHKDLVHYPNNYDRGLVKLKEYGFPELAVDDIKNPRRSLKIATNKCVFYDNHFSAIIVAATDKKHGLVVDDGMGLLDEDGNPYSLLKEGKYKLRVVLLSYKNEVLGMTHRDIKIGKYNSQAIVRFNPVKHKLRMLKWCKENNIPINNDCMPGYLNPYLNFWMYHMGLLTMYRACDLSFYNAEKIKMFVYLIDPTSTSYATELAYLQKKRKISDNNSFVAYHYQYGENELKKVRKGSKKSKIIKFNNDYLHICRVDVLKDGAKENFFNLNEKDVKEEIVDLKNIKIKAGSKIAIMGVVKPMQFNPDCFELRKDNTYKITNNVDSIEYKYNIEGKKKIDNRKLLMQRYDKKLIGSSVYEFYNIFNIKKSYKNQKIKFDLFVKDKRNKNTKAKTSLIIHVI